MSVKYLPAVAVMCMALPCLAAVATSEIGVFNGECVAYARSQVPSLPTGLTSMRDKLRIVNGSMCKPGAVAIIELSGQYAMYGHVAVVEACSKDGITVREANWHPGKITRRVATGGIPQAVKELKIMGYFSPT